MDGFFVAKFQKLGPTPANAVRANGVDKSNKPLDGEALKESQEEVIDKTPIGAAECETQDDFGAGFEDDEDKEYMERAKRNAMRRRGLDPRALKKPSSAKKAEKAAEGEGEKAVEKKGGEEKKEAAAAEVTEKIEKLEVVEEKKVEGSKTTKTTKKVTAEKVTKKVEEKPKAKAAAAAAPKKAAGGDKKKKVAKK